MIPWQHRRYDAAEATRDDGSSDLFRARLEQIINMKLELVQLAVKLDWHGSTARLRRSTATRSAGVETRFVIGLLLLKHIYGLSDEGVCERWVHDPYFQYFTGESSSSMSSRTSARPEPLAQAAGR